VKPQDAESDKRYLDKVTPIYFRRFTFYGKVVDEKERPIVAADVRYSINNNPNPMKSGTRGELTSDANGDFVIEDRGMSILIDVSKDGYYQMPRTDITHGSRSDFQNYDKLGNREFPIPAKDKPAIFVLRKMGEGVPLVHVGKRSIIVPKDGTPTEIDLGTGQVVAASKGQLRVEVWTQNQGMNPNRGQHYDWRCRLTIVGGGLVERTGQFDFEAPEGGYEPTAELAQSATAERWRPSMAKQFFVRLADNRYARIKMEMIAGGDHFIVLESYLNPKPGSRNLEFDSSKLAPAPTAKP